MHSRSISTTVATQPAAARLQVSAANELMIEHADGRRHAIHPIWLRERCQDASTLDLQTGQRLHDPSDLDPQLTLMAVTPIPASTAARTPAIVLLMQTGSHRRLALTSAAVAVIR